MQMSTPRERPSLIEEKMAEFDKALSKVDTIKKAGYLKAKEKCLDESGYDFKLAFLRCEDFNVKPAVGRWIKYWDICETLFLFVGDKAFLSMSAHGTMQGSNEALQCEYIQVPIKWIQTDVTLFFLI